MARDKVVLALDDFNHLRLPDDSLDFVLLRRTFHHSDDPAAMLREIRRRRSFRSSATESQFSTAYRRT